MRTVTHYPDVAVSVCTRGERDVRQRGRACRMEQNARLPGFLLGIGLGGFVDGILLPQVLQWHHMLTSTAGHPMTTVAGLEANTLADGFFHVATWIVVAAGSWLMWRAGGQGRVAPPPPAPPRVVLARRGAVQPVQGP